MLAGCAAPEPERATGGPVLANFDRFPEGHLPASLEAVVGNWTIANDSAAPSPPRVLAALGPGPDLLRLRAGSLADLDATLHLQGPANGSAGFVVRYRSASDYDIVVLDAAAQELQLRHADGARLVVQRRAPAAIGEGWHALHVGVFRGSLDAQVDGGARLAAPGGSALPGEMGLWAQGGRAAFDSLAIQPVG